MASIHSYEGWWDLSLIDDRNERALLSAFVAVIAVWATTVPVRALLSSFPHRRVLGSPFRDTITGKTDRCHANPRRPTQ